MSDVAIVLLCYPPGFMLGIALYCAWERFTAWLYWRKVPHTWSERVEQAARNYSVGIAASASPWTAAIARRSHVCETKP